MTQISEQLRMAVAARASGRCEYCMFPQAWSLGLFECDHIKPRGAGGETIAENLAFACSVCNAYKWMHTDGFDELTGETVPLFNPRTQVWTEHFRWSAAEPFTIEGTTPCGRATVARLQMNHQRAVTLRQLLAQMGVSVSR